MGNLAFVMAVTLVTWLGVFGYLLYVDRSLRRLENSTTEQEKDLL